MLECGNCVLLRKESQTQPWYKAVSAICILLNFFVLSGTKLKYARSLMKKSSHKLFPSTFRILCAIFTLILLFCIESCSKNVVKQQERHVKMHNKSIEEVLKHHTDSWMAIDGVEGTAIGLFEDKPCIKIFSSIKAEQLRAKIPVTIEGYPVIIKETGTFHALDE